MGMYNTVKIELNTHVRHAGEVERQTKDIEPLDLAEYRMDRKGRLWKGDEEIEFKGDLRVIGYVPQTGRLVVLVFHYNDFGLEYFARRN